MIRRDHSAVGGLCASLMVHGLFAAGLVGGGKEDEKAQPAVVTKAPLKVIAIEEKGAVASIETAPHPALSPEYGGEGHQHEKAASNGALASGGGVAGDPAPMSESESD